MAAIGKVFRRPSLLVRGTLADRDRPNLHYLRSIEDPDEFVWAILPHAARSFAACIVFLPRAEAKAAAVAYLYCRMLDTYEDLHPQGEVQREALSALAGRLEKTPLEPPPPLHDALATDNRDRVHLLLVERCELVDRVFLTLAVDDRANISHLVGSMGRGMVWSSKMFEDQGGALESPDQLTRYCHHVIGEPVLFSMRLLDPAPMTKTRRDDALAVSEMIQLANITRDIEKDLSRGIAYHPSLRPYLYNDPAADPQVAGRVRQVREELLVMALLRVTAYRRLLADLDSPRISAARASAVLMLLFTDRYYRSCAQTAGHAPWPGPKRTSTLVMKSALAALSPRRAHRLAREVEGNFLEAATMIEAGT